MKCHKSNEEKLHICEMTTTRQKCLEYLVSFLIKMNNHWRLNNLHVYKQRIVALSTHTYKNHKIHKCLWSVLFMQDKHIHILNWDKCQLKSRYLHIHIVRIFNYWMFATKTKIPKLCNLSFFRILILFLQNSYSFSLKARLM